LRIAVEHMTPVFLLTDGYIANGAEPWLVPKAADLKPIKVSHPTAKNSAERYLPYLRDDRLVRPWAIPGTPGLEHRIGGLEKADITGDISYDPDNHQHMTEVRHQKVANIANSIPEQTVLGPADGDLLVVSWGGTYGAVRAAVERCQRHGKSVAHAHLRYLNPFPRNLGELLRRYRKVLVPELNTGQLRFLLRANFLVDAQGLNKIKGKPFLVGELVEKMEAMLST
jgi:2-oxoglutarate/2-oxoacid ferredoxin oxidoreductase subunit alpha